MEKSIYYKSAEYKNKAINENGEDVYTFIFSTNSIDRDNEIIETLGIDFTNFQTNPVVLKSHRSYELPIGKVIRLWIENDMTKTYLLGDIVFGTDSESQEIKAKVDSGILRAVSIGFKCIEWTYNENSEIRVFTKTELLEVSLVSLPANPDAVRVKDLANKEIDYIKINEIIDKNFKSYLENYELKYGAAISRTNKQKIKDVYDMLSTLVIDLNTCITALTDIAGTIEEVETIDTVETPQEPEKAIEDVEIKEDTNKVDITITNKNELLQIIKGKK